MKKYIRNFSLIMMILVCMVSILPLMDSDSSNVYAIGNTYSTKSATCWESSNLTVNISAGLEKQTLVKPASTAVSYKTLSKKTLKSTVSRKGSASTKTSTAWVSTSYQWTSSAYKRIRTYRETTVKTTFSGKKKSVTTTVRRKTVAETYKHFNTAININAAAPLADQRVRSSFVKSGWKLYYNSSMSGISGNDNYMTGLTRDTTINGKTVKQIDVRVPEVTYHELGHYLALATGRSDITSEFKSIMKSEYGRNGNPVKPQGSITAEEYFADAFAAYCENASVLKAKAPKTCAYIAKQINKL